MFIEASHQKSSIFKCASQKSNSEITLFYHDSTFLSFQIILNILKTIFERSNKSNHENAPSGTYFIFECIQKRQNRLYIRLRKIQFYNFSYFENGPESLSIKREVKPEPVPPPKEWKTKKPWRPVQLSESFRILSRTLSMSSLPIVQ